MNQDLQSSDYRIRKLIGILGLSLPIVLPLLQTEFLASISHFYYGKFSSLYFIIVLATFALFLISYKGYTIDSATEKLSDDLITNIGGFAALIVVIIPTKCSESASAAIDIICSDGYQHLLEHNDKTQNIIHLVSAGIFILSMGWMSKYKFTRGENDLNNKLYKFCGNMVFITLGILVVFTVLDRFEVSFPLKNYYVFIFETIAIIPFGISWLIKGKAIDDVKEMFSSTKV